MLKKKYIMGEQKFLQGGMTSLRDDLVYVPSKKVSVGRSILSLIVLLILYIIFFVLSVLILLMYWL